MMNHNMPEWIVLVPPLVTFFAVVTTKRASLSLFAGIVMAMYIETILYNTHYSDLVTHVSSVVIKNNEIRVNNLSILLFLWMLGILISVLTKSGAVEVIGNILNKKIKSKIHAKLAVLSLGIIFFIDDFFNSLAIGAASRSLFDKKGLSREKLAYYLDSTAAPVCVLVPLSSWGAFIISILDNSLGQLGAVDYNVFELFMQSAAYNFYAIITLVILFIVSITDLDFSQMKKFESAASVRILEQDYNDTAEAMCSSDDLPKLYGATFSIIGLFVISLIFMFITGYIYSPSENLSIFVVLGNVKLGISLMIASIFSLYIALFFSPISMAQFRACLKEGLKTMGPAIQILTLAWIFSSVMESLNIGQYLSGFMNSKYITPYNIPLIAFLVAGTMSLLMGSSWVTFSILLPIACQICLTLNPALLPISIGAVLGGAVFGDHCSPISDTSILSSTGAGCGHMDHVTSQIPYCLLAMCISCLIYIIYLGLH